MENQKLKARSYGLWIAKRITRRIAIVKQFNSNALGLLAFQRLPEIPRVYGCTRLCVNTDQFHQFRVSARWAYRSLDIGKVKLLSLWKAFKYQFQNLKLQETRWDLIRSVAKLSGEINFLWVTLASYSYELLGSHNLHKRYKRYNNLKTSNLKLTI